MAGLFQEVKPSVQSSPAPQEHKCVSLLFQQVCVGARSAATTNRVVFGVNPGSITRQAIVISNSHPANSQQQKRIRLYTSM
jgi:hypothetical protein